MQLTYDVLMCCFYRDFLSIHLLSFSENTVIAVCFQYDCLIHHWSWNCTHISIYLPPKPPPTPHTVAFEEPCFLTFTFNPIHYRGPPSVTLSCQRRQKLCQIWKLFLFPWIFAALPWGFCSYHPHPCLSSTHTRMHSLPHTCTHGYLHTHTSSFTSIHSFRRKNTWGCSLCHLLCVCVCVMAQGIFSSGSC